MTPNYNALEAAFKDIDLIRQSAAILGWDANTMMPEGSSESRGDQLAVLSRLAHQKLVSAETSSLLNGALKETAYLNNWQKANLKLMEHEIAHNKCIPEDLVAALTKASNDCEMLWRRYKKENDYKSLLPSFKKVVELTKQLAEIKSKHFNVSKYDALLDMYDPERKSANIDKIFAQLEEFLPTFIKKISSEQPNLEGHFPTNLQKELGLYFMGQFGFDFSKGRLDESAHPFCGGTPDDIRITTRYDEKDFLQAFYGIVHETGHALYEANLPAEWRHQPVGQAIGMSSHESQSLFVEKQICKSKEFISLLLPKLHQYFALDKSQWTYEKLLKYAQHVKPSLIRVEADEVTYPLHVIMRYKIEKAIIEDDLDIEKLPEIWNGYMQNYFGIIPDSDAKGCMQDIHWFSGAIGYFPTYTLGALTAAQLMAKIKQDIPETPSLILSGNFTPIFGWLKENIHSKGSLYLANELLHEATGEYLNPQYFIDHVINRYDSA